MPTMILVFLGSALGGIARYGFAFLVPKEVGSLPFATWVVNVLGCLLIGFVNELVLRKFQIQENVKLFLTTGFCGGFTTYSTFQHEWLRLVQSRGWLLGGSYFLATTLGCALAYLVGMLLASMLTKVSVE